METAVQAYAPEEIRAELAKLIDALPEMIEQDDPKGGVLRPWVRKLPLRYQGVLITAIRGCDAAQKEDSSKVLTRMVRRAMLNPADPRESLNKGGFFGFDRTALAKGLTEFFHSLDQYPLHYVMHLCHASEVIAYSHPRTEFSEFFTLVYQLFCHTMHLNPESADAMHLRLTEDRIAKGTTARNF